MTSFRVRLRTPELRARQGKMSQSQLAKLAGLTPATISNLESGKLKRIELDTLAKLSRALRCTLDDLFEITDQSVDDLTQKQKSALSTLMGTVAYKSGYKPDLLDRQLSDLEDQQYKKS
ncbi:MAG: helix-turn-helix transcriptional regulator [Cyanobacteria bacterium]|nr:helix-turn-helix transcriptional regulator [Cyanobacteriota bacterium]